MPEREPRRRPDQFSVFLNVPYDSGFENLYLAYIAGLSAMRYFVRKTRQPSVQEMYRIYLVLRRNLPTIMRQAGALAELRKAP
jgi:hypothetical protein